MDKNKKELYIIGGVSGAIGNAILAALSRKRNIIVYGLSRKMQHYSVFKGKLPLSTIGLSIGKDISNNEEIDYFINKIDLENISKIHYVHAVGKFSHEFSKPSEEEISEIELLSHKSFIAISDRLLITGIPFSATLIGSVSDKYKIKGFQSWWKTIEKTKHYMKSVTKSNVSMNVINIASIISSQELMVRPLVFVQTEAKPFFWLTPTEVAEKIIEMSEDCIGYTEEDFFHVSDYYFDGYYESSNILERRIKELYKNE